MAVPKTVVWERDPHTKAKHNILRFYLDAYFPILASSTWSSAGLSFVDAFAGPGEYKDGSLGSPIIAVTSASRVVAEHATDIRVVLVEKEADRFEHLHSMVEEMAIPDRVSVTMTQGACEQVLVTELDRLGLWNAPMFVNFDGWGVDTPFELIRRVGSGRRPEVLVTFGSQWFTRFAGQEEVGAGDRVFGDQGWRAVANLATPSEKKRFLVDEYRRRLTQAGFEYHLTFELVDEGGNPLFLVFGTGSDRGVEKMKDAMWRVDSASGSKFRDPRDRNQMAFELSDNDPDLTLLRQQILEQLDSGPKTLAELQRFALLETVFKKGHARTAVDELETARRVVCQHRQAYDRFVVTKAPDSLF